MELARLSAQVEAGFANLYRRLDDQARALHEINSEVKRTNGRVTLLETQEAVRRSERERERAAPDGMTLTLGHAKWYVVFALAAVGGTIAVLEFFGRLQP